MKTLVKLVISASALIKLRSLFLSANVRAKTSGELQSPVHYAAKFNAVGSLKVLMDNHADVNDRDYKRRTPLFVAAEAGMSFSVNYFGSVFFLFPSEMYLSLE